MQLKIPSPKIHSLSDAEYESLKNGYSAPTMDDKWSLNYSDNEVIIKRSWSGTAIYLVKLRQNKNRRHSIYSTIAVVTHRTIIGHILYLPFYGRLIKSMIEKSTKQANPAAPAEACQ